MVLMTTTGRQTDSHPIAGCRPAIDQFAAGQPAMLIADHGAKNTPPEIIVAGQYAATRTLAFMVRYGSGFVRVAMTDDDADRLDLPSMFLPGSRNRDSRDTVAVDARDGVTTGISAADRARTIRVLADPHATPGDLTRPGHVIPMRVSRSAARSASLSWTALAIADMAGLSPVVAMCSLVSAFDPADMATEIEGERFAADHHMPCLYASQISRQTM